MPTLLVLTFLAGGDWATTFPGTSVGTHIQGKETAVVVIAAGDNTATSAAATALATALRNSGKAKLVMTGESLGSLASLDDAAVVERAKNLPIDQIFVVRVFPGGTGSPASAVVTMYSKSGTILGGFSGASGEAIAPAEGADTGAGVSSAAASAVASITDNASGKQTKMQEEYDKRHVWFANVTTFNNQTGVVLAVSSVPYKGNSGEPLHGADFYDYIGHSELAQRYRSRYATRLALMLGGGAVSLGGIGLAVLGEDKRRFYSADDFDDGCQSLLGSAGEYRARVAMRSNFPRF